MCMKVIKRQDEQYVLMDGHKFRTYDALNNWHHNSYITNVWSNILTQSENIEICKSEIRKKAVEFSIKFNIQSKNILFR